MSIQWRPQLNVLTNPPSYRMLYVPVSTVGYTEMATDISAQQPIYSEETVRAVAPLIIKWMQEQLINGRQVTLEDAFSLYLSFTGKLESPDDPMPEGNDFLRINMRVALPYLREVQHRARYNRLAKTEKVPVISSTEDTKLKLPDVLFAEGLLKLFGTHLDFDEENPLCGCTIEGTRSGEQKQELYGSITNTEILLAPDIPAQEEPWNNEYTVTVTTQYSEHGTLRSGTCSRRLRTPLLVQGLSFETGPGILTGAAAAPYVRIQSGEGAESEMLRIQAAYDAQAGGLHLSLLGMKSGTGALLAVTANGTYTLHGFSGSAISSLEIIIDNYDGLFDLVRNSYSGRLVDILDIRLT